MIVIMIKFHTCHKCHQVFRVCQCLVIGFGSPFLPVSVGWLSAPKNVSSKPSAEDEQDAVCSRPRFRKQTTHPPLIPQTNDRTGYDVVDDVWGRIINNWEGKLFAWFLGQRWFRISWFVSCLCLDTQLVWVVRAWLQELHPHTPSHTLTHTHVTTTCFLHS